MPDISATDASRGAQYAAEHPERATPSAPTRPAPPREVDPHGIVEDAGAREILGAFARRGNSVAATVGAMGPVLTEAPRTPSQQRLDAYRAAYSGPYRVDGQQVSAAPQFRMTRGFNDANAAFELTPNGPADEKLHGVYRFR